MGEMITVDPKNSGFVSTPRQAAGVAWRRRTGSIIGDGDGRERALPRQLLQPGHIILQAVSGRPNLGAPLRRKWPRSRGCGTAALPAGCPAGISRSPAGPCVSSWLASAPSQQPAPQQLAGLFSLPAHNQQGSHSIRWRLSAPARLHVSHASTQHYNYSHELWRRTTGPGRDHVQWQLARGQLGRGAGLPRVPRGPHGRVRV